MSKNSLIATLFLLIFNSVYGATVDSVKVIDKDGMLEAHIFTDASEYKDSTRSYENLQYSMIVIDFFDSHHNLRRNWVSVNKGNLLRIRSSQYTNRITRIVLDVKQITDYVIHKKENGIVVRLSKLAGQAKQLTTKTDKESDSDFFYSSRGKRDPFRPLVSSKPRADTLLDVGHAVLKGIMWSPEERYALLQDKSGKGYILQEGDKVRGGKIFAIRQKEVICKLYSFGKLNTVRLELVTNGKK